MCNFKPGECNCLSRLEDNELVELMDEMEDFFFPKRRVGKETEKETITRDSPEFTKAYEEFWREYEDIENLKEDAKLRQDFNEERIWYNG